MRHKCINCGVEWGGELDEDGFYSHGVCRTCCREALRPIYRKRQREEIGSWECFGNAIGNCSQKDCKYYYICVLKEE